MTAGPTHVEHLERPDWCAEITVPDTPTVHPTANSEHAASRPHATTRGTKEADPAPRDPRRTP